MAVEGNQQTDMNEVGGVVCEDKPNLDSERIDDASGQTLVVSGLETGIVAKQNQGANTSESDSVLASGVESSLGCGEKGNDDSERRCDVVDAAKSGTEGSQQMDDSGLNSGLASQGRLNDDSHVRINEVGDEALWFDASEILLPMNVEDGDAGIGIDVARDATDEFDASKRISLVHDQDDTAEIRTDFTKGEVMDDDDNVANYMNHSPVLKCTSSVDEIVLPAKKGESRERKQSKYLSPPYVNLKDLSRGMKSPTVSRSGSIRRRKKWQEMSVSSSELLSELHLAALDCRYPWENNQFDATEMFFTMFRSSVFNFEKELVEDATKENAIAVHDNDQNLQSGSPTNSGSKPKRRKRMKKADNGSPDLLPTALFDVNVNVASTPSALYLSQGNKEGNSMSLEHKEAVSISDLNGNSPKTIALVGETREEDPLVLAGVLGPKKRGRKKGTVSANLNSNGNPETKKRQRKQKHGTSADDLPDANASIPSTNSTNAKSISLEVCLPTVGPNPSSQLNTNSTPRSLNTVDNSSITDQVQSVNGVDEAGLSKTASEPADEAPSLSQVRQKLEQITTMLGKAGDNLSLEMKVTLENEIQGLLEKVSSISTV